MRILITIPHYFGSGPDHYSSTAMSHREVRLNALRRCITSLHQLFGTPAAVKGYDRTIKTIAGCSQNELSIIICTYGEQHLLHDLKLDQSCFKQTACCVDNPMQLGFCCHTALKEHIGSFDWYCYLEDDLVIQDPFFFEKLTLFNHAAGQLPCLALPHRYELSEHSLPRKIYIDGDLWPDNAAVMNRLRLPGCPAEIQLTCPPNGVVDFLPAQNPHAGCFFLTEPQLRQLAEQAWFGKPLSGLAGPLESAATLPLMTLFNIYKPALNAAAYFEIQHASQTYTGQGQTH